MKSTIRHAFFGPALLRHAFFRHADSRQDHAPNAFSFRSRFRLILIAGLALSAFLPSVSALFATEFHVAVNGSDENAGTLEAPFATLLKARNAARAVTRGEEETVTIYVHGGDYYLTKLVTFGKEDHHLLITGWQDEKPRFFGGIQIKNWKKSDFRGLPNVFEADLAELGVTRRFRQLFHDGKRQTWCRYPNYDAQHPFAGGWAYVDGQIFGMYVDVPDERCDLVQVKEKDFHDWEKPSEGMICLFPRYNWWNVAADIKEMDAKNHTLTLTRPMGYAARPVDRYHVMGLREELDAAGEWYQDVDAQKLYFIPPDEKLMETSVTIPVPDGIFALEQSRNVVFRGLDLCGAENFGIRMNQCEDCAIEKSFLHDMVFFGGACAEINGGQRCQVLGCDVWNSGGHGISVNGGDRKAFTKCGHNIENNYLHHCGQLYRHGIGVILGGMGVRVAHNRIHDLPRCGIFHSGQCHMIEFNDIYFTNLEMEDTGAIYGGGWTGGIGTTIRFNRCTDSIGFGHDREGKYHFFMFAWGIYLDEACCGVDVYGNFVKNCQIGAMHLHNARENHIENNIFVSNAGPKGTARQFSLQGWNDSPQGVFLRDRQPKQLKTYEELVNGNPKWLEFRGMHVSPADPFLPDGTMMRGNLIEHNIFYYPDQPDSTYASASSFNFEANRVDRNVIFAGGAPIKTGRRACREIAGAEGLAGKLIKNSDFSQPVTAEEQAKNPALTAAAGWSWYSKTYPEIRSEIVTNAESQNALRVYAAFNDEKKYIKNSCVRSAPFALEQGKDYRLRFRLRMAEDAENGMDVRFVTEQKGLWKAFGAASFSQKDSVCETTFHFPKAGEKDFDERTGDLTIHFQMRSKTGWFEISDLQVMEVVALSDWQSWQEAGADVNSVTEDPLFVDPANGDYRLKPESPALKLGFEPIPFEKIGPYESEKRVTWPIRDAEGVREHPEWLTVPEESGSDG